MCGYRYSQPGTLFRSPGLKCATIIVAGSFLFAGSVALVAHAADRGSGPIGTEQGVARAAATALQGRDVRLERLSDDSRAEWRHVVDFIDLDDGDIYMVDEGSGRLLSWGSRGAAERSAGNHQGQGGAMSRRSLERAASRIVAERLPRWSGLPASVEIVTCGVRTDGTLHQIARCVFREYVDDIATCNFVELTLNVETGELIGLLQSEGSIDVDTSAPALSEEEALKTIALAARMPIYSVKESERMVWRVPGTDEPCLVLRAVLTTGDEFFGASCEGFVDLHTGELLSLGM